MQSWAKKKPTKDYFSNYLNLSCSKISLENKKHSHNYIFTTSLFLLSLSHFLALRTMKKLFAITRWLSGKEFACQAGDLGSIPGLWRSPGEGNDNPLQYSCLENSMDGGTWWATVHGVAKSWTRLSDFTHSLSHPLPRSFVTFGQLTWSLGWEDPLEEGKATHSSILAWRIPCTV